MSHTDNARSTGGGKKGAKASKRGAGASSKHDDPRTEPARWKGDAVEASDPAGESAEQAASRAEGNAPVAAEAAAAGDDEGTFLESATPRTGDEANDEENAEEKRLAAAEEHARRSGEGPIRGRL